MRRKPFDCLPRSRISRQIQNLSHFAPGSSHRHRPGLRCAPPALPRSSLRIHPTFRHALSATAPRGAKARYGIFPRDGREGGGLAWRARPLGGRIIHSDSSPDTRNINGPTGGICGMSALGIFQIVTSQLTPGKAIDVYVLHLCPMQRCSKNQGVHIRTAVL